jgi:predicted permease
MTWFTRVWVRVAALFGKAGMDAEMDEEVRFHLEMETEKNLRTGLDAREARRQALVAFGGVERFKEQSREERGVRPLEEFITDSRYALRGLFKNPVFTAVAVLSLAAGIGANTAIFSVVNAILIRDMPFESPEELVNIYRDRERMPYGPLSYPDYLEIQEATSHLFQELGGYQYTLSQRDRGEGVEKVLVEMVTGNYMPLLGIRPALGRTLLPEDHRAPGAHPVVVLGYRYWQDAFGGDPGVLGREITVSGRSYSVVGVAPRDFPGSLRAVAPDLFAPIMMVDQIVPAGWNPLESRGTNAFMPVGRLWPGATLAQLQVVLENVALDQKETYPGVWDQGDELRALSSQDVILNPEADGIVTWVNSVALVIVGLVLLIACANLAGFLLARAVDRRKEVALRLSLGATRGRLVRQLLTETLVLAGLGAAIGVPLSAWILSLGMGTTLPFPLPLGFDPRLDRTVLAFTVGVTLVTGVMVGLLPALQATRPELTPALKDEGTGGQGSRILALSRVLVAGQMAMSVILLVTAGLFVRSFGESRRLDPGFGEDPTAVLSFLIPSEGKTEEERLGLLAAVMEDAREVPGVSRVGAISNLHLNPINSMFLEVNVEGVQPPAGRSAHLVDFTSVSEGFFRTAGISLMEGRDFGPQDRADGFPVAVINQAMANQFWPDRNALGQTIDIAIPDWDDPTVVGIVATAKIKSLAEPPTPFMYLPFTQEYNSAVSLLAVGPDPRASSVGLYRMVRERYPSLIISGSNTLEEHVGVMLIFSRLTALLTSVFAVMALGLSIIGLYGVVSYSVARRAKEMGIRLSLGADPWGVVFLQLRDGMRLVVVGGIVGLLVGALAAQGIAGFLVGVPAVDFLTFGGALGILLPVAFLAVFVPARRSLGINPTSSLRAE